jgi:hypothetical protein
MHDLDELRRKGVDAANEYVKCSEHEDEFRGDFLATHYRGVVDTYLCLLAEEDQEASNPERREKAKAITEEIRAILAKRGR